MPEHDDRTPRRDEDAPQEIGTDPSGLPQQGKKHRVVAPDEEAMREADAEREEDRREEED